MKQAAVAETRIGLAAGEILLCQAQFGPRLRDFFLQAEIEDRVVQRAAQQELHRQVIRMPTVGVPVRIVGVDPVLHHAVSNRQRQSQIFVMLRLEAAIPASQRVVEMAPDIQCQIGALQAQCGQLSQPRVA